MANSSYTAFKSGILTGGYDLDTAVIKVALVRGYTFSAAHATMADVAAAGGVINGVPATLANVSVTGGVFDADDCTIAVTLSAVSHVLVVYQASAVGGGADVAAASQKLMWYLDTGTNLPVTPPGDVTMTITWPTTAAKIYKVGA